MSHIYLSFWGEDVGLLQIDLDEFLLMPGGFNTASWQRCLQSQAIINFKRLISVCTDCSSDAEEHALWASEVGSGGANGSGSSTGDSSGSSQGGQSTMEGMGNALYRYTSVFSASNDSWSTKAWGTTRAVLFPYIHFAVPDPDLVKAKMARHAFTPNPASCGALVHLVQLWGARKLTIINQGPTGNICYETGMVEFLDS